MALAATNRQIPDQAILDLTGRQTYLGNQYAVPFVGTSLSSSEADLFLISNATNGTGTGIGVFFNLSKLVCLTASSTALIRAYSNPTVSGAGSAATAINMRPSYGVTGSKATIATGITTSANGTLIDFIGSSTLVSAASNNLIILDPGQSLLITGQGSGSITIDAVFGWYEI